MVPAATYIGYIGLGANLGGDLAALRATMVGAWHTLANLPDTQLLATSSLWRSAPVDATGPDYLNAVVALRTRLQPLPLLHALQAIEQAHGRQRPYRNAPRTLDLDLLMLGDIRLNLPELTLPHPRLHLRAFALRPLLEVAPEQAGLDRHLAALSDQVLVKLPTSTDWPPVAGSEMAALSSSH